ncbi:MAG: peptidoglycan DD-metalloendopeptidase family protein [Actinomycetota bacterium]|nr:peptidoglycan DD-metalloendopeptidase family protein [Actinomycetota bacterium]
MKKRRIALIVFLVLGLAAPAVAAEETQVTPDDLDAARRRNAEISASLEATDIRYEAAIADEIQIRESLHGLASKVTETEQRLATLRLTAEDVVRELYMTAGSDGAVSTVLGSAAFCDIPVRETYLDAASNHDLRVVDQWVAVEAEYRAQVQELDDALALQRDLVTEIESLAEQLLVELDAANSEYRELQATWQRQEEERKQREAEAKRLRELEEARKRKAAEEAAAAAATAVAATAISPTTAAPAATTTTTSTTTTTAPSAAAPSTTVAPTTTTTLPSDTGSTTTTTTTVAATTTTAPPTTTTTVPPPVTTAGRVCPVDGAVSFSDTWGAPRSGGRTHKGVDMSASRGTPLVALESGGIYRLSTSSLGGISVYLRGNSGDIYYYAHLDAWAEGLAGGQKVSAGDLLGYVGTTGNSPSWIPHLHLGWKPGGGDWANPYPMVNALCR